MNNWKEYKDDYGYSMFILLNDSDKDLLETQKEITSMGYIITEMGSLSIDLEERTVIKARRCKD